MRARTVEGPLEPCAQPTMTEILTRRYMCRACGAVLVVVPRGVGRRHQYSRGAIATALALWAYERVPASRVRTRISTANDPCSVRDALGFIATLD